VPLNFWAGYLEKLTIVALLLGALYLFARFLQQPRLAGRSGRCLSLIEATPLTQQAALYVVRAGPRYFLIGAGAGSISTLAELAPSDVTAYTLK
jgi:flagellar biogenesis protein FliO